MEPQNAFRRYLEAAGVIDALTKGMRRCRASCQPRQAARLTLGPRALHAVLVSLYEEADKPKQAIE